MTKKAHKRNGTIRPSAGAGALFRPSFAWKSE